MKHIRTEIIINASPEQVWSILTDFAHYAEWNPFMTEVEGTAQKGSKLRNTMMNGGKKYIFKPTVTQCEPSKRFAWLGSLLIKGIFDGHHFFEIIPLANNQVKLVQGEDFAGVLSGWILRKIGTETRNNFIRMNQALKERAEQTQ